MSFATFKILPIVFCLFFVTSFSQNDFITTTKDNGLTAGTILTSKVDSKGIVWVGTVSGLSAFVGDKWVEVKNISDRDGNDVDIGRVSSFFETTAGEIWVATNNGIFIFNGKYWTHFNDNENKGFSISEIFEDRRGWIWVIYEKYQSLKEINDIGFSLVEGIIQMYNGMNWHDFPAQIGGSAAVTIGDPNIYFTSHIQDNEGNLWVTSLDGTYKFDGKEWIEYNEEQLSTDICNQVLQSHDKTIWVATKYGVSKKVNDDWVNYENNKGIKGNAIKAIFQDNKNRIWAISTRDNRFRNLCYYHNDGWKVFTKADLKAADDVDKLINFKQEVLAFSKKGISLFDGKKWTNLLVKNGIDEDKLSNLTVISNERILFTGRNGLYELLPQGLTTIFNSEDGWKPVTIHEDNYHNIWVGTEKNGLYRFGNGTVKVFNTENGHPSNNINEVFEDKGGNIWVVSKSAISKIRTTND